MDISIVNDYFVPAVVVMCLCIGYIMRNWMPTDNKWIPTVLFVFGIVCGIVVDGLTFTAVVSGAVSGLAAVGLNQAFKQALGLNVRPDIETTEEEVQDYELAEEEDEAEDEEEGEADE